MENSSTAGYQNKGFYQIELIFISRIETIVYKSWLGYLAWAENCLFLTKNAYKNKRTKIISDWNKIILIFLVLKLISDDFFTKILAVISFIKFIFGV